MIGIFKISKPKPNIMSVYVDKIVRDDKAPIIKYDPSHPNADSNGYVAQMSIPCKCQLIEMAD